MTIYSHAGKGVQRIDVRASIIATDGMRAPWCDIS
jgi:hypothetical protein